MASGSLPAACTASVCTLQPAALAIRATSGTGCTTPVSLLTSMREISPGSPVFSRCSSAAMSGSPSAVTAKGSSPGKPLSTESCSMAETSTG